MSKKIEISIVPTKIEGTDDSLLSSFSVQVSDGYHALIEEHFNLFVNEKPPYLPRPTWEYMLKTVLRVEIRRKP